MEGTGVALALTPGVRFVAMVAWAMGMLSGVGTWATALVIAAGRGGGRMECAATG